MFVSQLVSQYVVNNSLDPHNISQQFYMVNLDLSPHDQLKKKKFIPSFTFFQLLEPFIVNESDLGQHVGFLLKM